MPDSKRSLRGRRSIEKRRCPKCGKRKQIRPGFANCDSCRTAQNREQPWCAWCGGTCSRPQEHGFEYTDCANCLASQRPWKTIRR